METLDRLLAQERERFLSDGGDLSRVRPEVASSWRRCASWQVPVGELVPPYRPEMDPGAPLVRAAGPVLDSFGERLADLEICFLLSDVDGRLLDRRAFNPTLRARLDRSNIVPGFVFGEETAGTNGVGTTLELGRTTRIDGHEHYGSWLVGYTCVGVPIMDQLRQRCVGVLDVTCTADRDNRLVTLIAEQTARAIENRLVEQHSRRERALLAQFLQASKFGHGAVVAVNERVVMTNPRAARLLEGLDQGLLWDGAARIAESPEWGELTLADGRIARIHTRTLHEAGELLGAMIELTQPDTEREPQPVTRPNSSSVNEHDLIGRDPAFLDAVSRATRMPPGRVLIVHGEPGTGKHALALVGARAHDPRSEALQINAADVVQDGEKSWLTNLAAALKAAPSTLVVRHLELLSPNATRTFAALLSTAVDRGWWCAATTTAAESPVLTGLEPETAWLPPLRERLGDLPALVTAFAESAAVSSEVTQLLARLTWPGNVRQLHGAVRRIVANTPHGARSSLTHVPNELRRAATRARLTRFERAEVHAILEALAEVGGNKRQAAALLGISRTTLYRKLQAGGVDLENTMY